MRGSPLRDYTSRRHPRVDRSVYALVSSPDSRYSEVTIDLVREFKSKFGDFVTAVSR